MHSVLLELQHNAEVFKEMEKMRNAWLRRKMNVLNNEKIVQNVFKHLGLWNMKDEDFYANNNIYLQVLEVKNMCMSYGIFNVKYHKKLIESNLTFYRGLTKIPIECINYGVFAYELKAPFTKAFFEKLMDNKCNLLEFGSDYVFVLNGIYYGTPKLFELFYNQNITGYAKD